MTRSIRISSSVLIFFCRLGAFFFVPLLSTNDVVVVVRAEHPTAEIFAHSEQQQSPHSLDNNDDTDNSNNNIDDDHVQDAQADVHAHDHHEDKHLKICSIAGGLNIARLVSSHTRNLFRDALDDVELIREYISEAALNGGMVGGEWKQQQQQQYPDDNPLEALSRTLDWQARNLPNGTTTVEAGLGYADDRLDRRIERYVGLANQPLVGNKISDLALIDTASNIFPWLVDRKSLPEKWYVSHQNGQTRHTVDNGNGPEQGGGINYSERLYVAAWVGTRGEAWLYYPPLIRAYPDSHPLGFGDVLGPTYNSQEEEFIKPNLPANNPQRKSYFTDPYPDTAVPGLSLITAQAPIYYTGTFQGHEYNNTYIASTGVDISVASMSTLLDELEDTLTQGSFAFLVSASSNLKIVAISQSTVEKIYPARTGWEESRVTYNVAGDTVIADRRNQIYTVADTIHQSPVTLQNANWTDLAQAIQDLTPGERASRIMDLTRTGESEATSYYALYERWANVADWALIVMVPREKVDHAVNIVFLEEQVQDLEVAEGNLTTVSTTLSNNGTIDVTIQLEKLPDWLTLQSEAKDEYHICAGEVLQFDFLVNPADIRGGSATSIIAFTLTDDDYPDCFFEQVLTTKLSVKIVYEMQLNHLGNIRLYGLVLVIVVVASAIACSVWVLVNQKHRVVRPAQPLFLHVICVGILVMGLSIVPMGIDDAIVDDRGCSMACTAVPWLFSLGFAIAFSALFSKIWRINQIVQACQNYQRVDVKVHHVMIPFFIIFTANVVVLGLWTALDPLVWVRKTRDSKNGLDEFNSYGLCSFQNHSVAVASGVALLLINFLALVLALFQLYRARNVSIEYSEGKYIAIALASNLQVILTGLPILVLVHDSPQLQYFVKSSVVFVLAMSMLLLIFVPKVSILRTSNPSMAPKSGQEAHPDSKDAQRSSDRNLNVNMTNDWQASHDHLRMDDSLLPSKESILSGPSRNPSRKSSALPFFSDITEPSFLESVVPHEAFHSSYSTAETQGTTLDPSQRDPRFCTGKPTDPRLAGSFMSNANVPRRIESITEDTEFDPQSNSSHRIVQKSKNCSLLTPLAGSFHSSNTSRNSLQSNAAIPRRIESAAESIDPEPPTPQISGTERSLYSRDSLQSNAPMPRRVESVVEDVEPQSMTTRFIDATAPNDPNVQRMAAPLHSQSSDCSVPSRGGLLSNASRPTRVESMIEDNMEAEAEVCPSCPMDATSSLHSPAPMAHRLEESAVRVVDDHDDRPSLLQGNLIRNASQPIRAESAIEPTDDSPV